MAKAKVTPAKLIKKFTPEVMENHRVWLRGVLPVFEESNLVKGHFPVIHSIKSRIKDDDHLMEKIKRKLKDNDLNEHNILAKINDIAGIRLMHVHTKQFEEIHKLINKQVDSDSWVLHEQPKAYTWDPEAKDYYSKFGLDVIVKPTFYTSVHYVVKAKKDSTVFCEIQVRTLFEEIWGEIDHAINYPKETADHAVVEQLRVLSKLVGAGNRLNDSIFSCWKKNKNKPK